MNSVLIILGGNQGNVIKSIDMAVLRINELIGKVVNKSSLYQTEAWGKTNQNDFINQVIQVETSLAALDVLNKTLEIENILGRKRSAIRWQERNIDIDILFYNNEIINDDKLVIPHPYLQERKFVLIPLNELANDYIHPILKLKISELLDRCTDNLKVTKIEVVA